MPLRSSAPGGGPPAGDPVRRGELLTETRKKVARPPRFKVVLFNDDYTPMEFVVALLEQVFTPEQYARQVETVPGSGERVDFAIRFPGRREDGAPLWLPVDAKFPREDYERLLDAQERADPAAAESAAAAIETRLRGPGTDPG